MTSSVITEVPELVRGLLLREYYALLDARQLQNERIELLEGELVEMVPNGPRHASTVSLLAEALGRSLPPEWWLRSQLPLTVAPRSEPEPDVAIVPNADYSSAHPTTALLVVEVSVSSARVDLRVKPGIYAAAGVPEYWVIDVDERVVHVHRGVSAGAYGSVTVHRSGVLTSATDPVISIDPAAVLPRA